MSCKIIPSYFFRSNIIYFARKRPIKVQIFETLSAWMKIHQILVIFETINGFFSNLVSIFSVMRHNSSILFQLKFYILSIKGAYQNTNFTWAVDSLKFSTLMGSFCQNHIKFQLKKYRTVISHDTTEWCKVLRKHWLVVSNDMRIFGEFLPNHIKVWNFHFDGIRFELKKIHRSYLSWRWTLVQNLNKSWPCGFKDGMRNWLNFH